MKYICMVFLSLISAVPLYANDKNDDYYRQHATGWHWYDDPIEISEEMDEQGEPDKANKENPSTDPIEHMNVIKATIQRALDQAIIEPTPSNVKNYLNLQNQLMTQSGKFSSTWKETLLENPELDYSLIHPTNNIARQVESDIENADEVAAIETLAGQTGLFFFYRSTCPYCQRFAPILKNFAERYHITIIPITTDGISLPEFPNSHPDQGQMKTFNVTVEPSLFAVNPYTKEAYPVGYGLMSETDLKKRILEISIRLNNKTAGNQA